MVKPSQNISLFFARLFAVLSLFVSLTPAGASAGVLPAADDCEQAGSEHDRENPQDDSPVFNEGVRHSAANFDFSFKPDFRNFIRPSVRFYLLKSGLCGKTGNLQIEAPQLPYFSLLFRTEIAANAP